MKYNIAYYKTKNLTPDEKNVMRKNQIGIWLMGPTIEANSPRKACSIARKQYGYSKVKAI